MAQVIFCLSVQRSAFGDVPESHPSLGFLLLTRGLPELFPTLVSAAKRLTEGESDVIQHHMTDDSTSNPTRPKMRAPLLPPPAPISYRMIGTQLGSSAE